MNSGGFLTILLVGVLLSGCAQFDPYRTPTLPSPPADSQANAEEWPPEDWPPKCVVDKSLQVNDKPPLCENRASTGSHAIQHRHYSFKDNDQKPLDYYLSFVEFDDQGWFADRAQMEALFVLLKKLEEEDKGKQTNGHTLIYVYAHGWKHNASACDDNVVCFSRLLERTDLAEVQVPVIRQMFPEDFTIEQALGNLSKRRFEEMAKKVKRRTVVGVYLGWRGLPFDGALNNLSFWSRKDTAARVGRGGVFELLTRLKDYRDSRQKAPRRGGAATQLVITGHSFGGLVVYSALSHALMERAARTTNVNGATEYDVARSFGDLVMLVNPAFEGSLYEPLFHIATNRCYDEKKQRPVIMIVTSDADSATGKAFPMGQTLGTLFQHAVSSDQKRSMRKAIGHDGRYLTHHLRSDGKKAEKVPDDSDCPCPYLTPTSDRSLDEMLGLTIDALLKPKGYGKDVELTSGGSPQYTSSYPYLVVNTDKGVIADHNAIYNERFITFAQMFFIRHVTGSKPWTDHRPSVPNCWPEKKMPDGLVPFQWSCQLKGVEAGAAASAALDDVPRYGSSCSVPKQKN